MKVLFISGTNFFENTFTGGQKCSLKNYQILCDVFGKENVDGIVFGKKRLKIKNQNFIFYKSSLSKVETFLNCFAGYTRGYTKKCEKFILKKIAEKIYDIIYLDFSGYAVSIPKIKKRTNAKIYVFFHNIEYLYEKNRAEKENKLYYVSALSIRNSEETAVKYGDKLITLNSRDSQLLKKLYGREGDLELPISFKDSADFSKKLTGRSSSFILFVGALFGPNEDAVKWYCEKIAPYVQYDLLIVGKNMENVKKKYSADNVEIIGTVSDLSMYYNSALAVIMPIRYGDGMKVKTAEALMYGKTVIGTSEAFEGYKITCGQEGFLCDTAEDFINKINGLTEKDTYNEFSRKLFLEKYSLEVSVEAFRKMQNSAETELNNDKQK